MSDHPLAGRRARWLGARRVHVETCASTNDLALAEPHGTVVTAAEQTRGRGRAGRTWISPPGSNLYLSIALRQTGLSPAQMPAITLAAGIGLCDAIRAAGVARARLKWPNDVLAGDRKLAGILTEMTTRGAAVDCVVLGIGVDVAAVPPEVADLATSIADETGAPHGVARFAEALLDVLEPWLDRYLDGGVAAIAAAWEARADLTRRVRVVTEAGARDGTPLGLAADGALRVALDDGGEHRVLAGDVVEITSGSTAR